MERRFQEKECDWLERITTLEAELDGLRAEAVETRGRLRRAETSSPSAETFERYDTKRIKKQNAVHTPFETNARLR